MKILGHKLSLSAQIGFAIVFINVAAALLAPLVAPYGEAQMVGDIWLTPNMQHWLGTDQLGRDLLTRMLYGARTTIALALVTTLLSFAIGIIAGFGAAIAGRALDQVLSRIVDVMMSIPMLVFALVVIAVLGTSVPVLIGTLAILDSTRVFRVSRAVAMNIVVLDYVEVARLRGEGAWWILRKEVLPNAMAPLIAEFGLRFCFQFLLIAALSFLGLGIQPPFADWGSMVRENAQAINLGGLAPLIPAAAIAVLTIGVNLVVDWFLSIHSRGHGEGA